MGSFEISPPLPQLPLNSPNSPQLSPNPGEKKPINSCNKVLQNYSKGIFWFSVGRKEYDYYYYYENLFFLSANLKGERTEEENASKYLQILVFKRTFVRFVSSPKAKSFNIKGQRLSL